ncbi:MAG: ABC transporter substrate-binding protein [Mesorhizobium sp.]|uniref:ABC transporter substrate-binding protein n=1 Tax=Mesorhizobium sp. TaxID=1871066 RepID=UPI000FE46A66|nr:MAG: ABC transporter substrate-binding protein [Mesorhizobium sp.]
MSVELDYFANRAARGLMSRRAFMGRAAALGVTAAVANSVLSTAVRAAGPKNGGALKMGVNGGASTNSLDPALQSGQVPFMYMSTLGDKLTTISSDGEVLPSLAESWDSSPDAVTWTFKLRKGVQFHDGKTVTVDDVMKTIQRHSDKKSNSGAYGLLQGIKETKADGDNLVVTLKSANADVPYLMAHWALVIQPNGGFDKPDAGIFTGAYKLKAFEPGIRVAMEKFKNYWDPSVGHFDTVDITVINDWTARSAALQSGQVDMVNMVEPRVAGLLSRVPSVVIATSAGHGFNCFNMLCDAKPFNDNNVRMALKLAIDREELVQKVLAGYGSVGNDMPVNKAYPLFDESIPQRQYDPEKAKFYMKKSGYTGEILLITSEVAFPGAVDAASLFQQSAKKAGINITIRREPSDGYWDSVWNKQPLSACSWHGQPTQGLVYSQAYISSSDSNDTHFKNPKFDALISDAQGELDRAKRKALYSEAGKLIRDEGGLITPMFNNYIDAYREDRVAGWIPNPSSEMMNGRAAVLCWQA